MSPRLRRPRPGFPFSAPTHPAGVPWEPPDRKTGIDYDGEWSRAYPTRVARAAVTEWLVRPAVRAVIPPRVEGLDHLADLEGPAVFAANHASHLDTPLLLSTIPRRFRHKTVVAAAADYFFDTRWKSAFFSFTIAAVPIERTRVNRRSAQLPAELLADGWNVVIYPEGGRSPDGWGQPFTGGAAYLAIRSGAPLVPVHIEGTGDALGKGADRLRPGRTSVSFGRPLRPAAGEDARRLAARLQAEIAALADESSTNWWQARRRAAAGATPPLTGPQASPWRRAWERTAGGERTHPLAEITRRSSRWPERTDEAHR